MFNQPFLWENKNRVLITTHAFADADALGSVLALASHLRSRGLETILLVREGAPKTLRFLLGENEAVAPNSLKDHEFDLVVVLDCASSSLTGLDGIGDYKDSLVNIDHHPDNTFFGAQNLVDTTAASTAEIIYEIIKQDGRTPTSFESTSLLAGLAGDTGSFKHINATSKTLKMAGELMLHGANLSDIVKNIFKLNDSSQLKAWSHVIEVSKFDEEKNIIMAAITEEEMRALGIDEDAFTGVVEVLSTFHKASYSAFFRQRGEEVKVSLRSESFKNFNVSNLAAKFGGGGHKLAAGFSIPGKLIKKDGEPYIIPS